MRKLLTFLIPVFFLSTGIVIGGYLFAQSQPRTFLALDQGKIRLAKRDLAGLIASAGIQQLPGFVPSVVFETDKTIVINSPTPEARVDYVLFPKKDIKNIGEITNPRHQKITYLHFHLLID